MDSHDVFLLVASCELALVSLALHPWEYYLKYLVLCTMPNLSRTYDFLFLSEGRLGFLYCILVLYVFDIRRIHGLLAR